MNQNQLIAQRIREVFLNGQWIANTNYKDQISLLSLEQANRKYSELNSVAQLVFHINYYLEGVLEVFEKGELNIRDKYSFDMPEITNVFQWQNRVNNLLNNAEKLSHTIEQMDENLLYSPFVDEKYGDYLRNLEGLIEHSYYHLGQISLLNRLGKAEKR